MFIYNFNIYFIFYQFHLYRKKGLTILSDLLFYAVIPILVRISIIIGITTTNSIVLIMTRPVAKGKSDFASLARLAVLQ